MSGEKRRYTRVEDRELRRLREQESRLRSLRQDLPERLASIQKQTKQEFQRRLVPLEARSRQQQQELLGLRSNLQDLERETNQRLQQQRQEFNQSIQASESRQQQALERESSRLKSAMKEGFAQQRQEYLQITRQQRQEYLNLIEQQEQKFTNLIQIERKKREKGQQIIQTQINQVVENLEQEKKRKQIIAQDLLEDITTIWQQIERDYQHQRFAPGRLQDLQRGLDMSRSNIQANVTEAAIATCQQTYLDLADLRLELEQKEQEWQLYYYAALTDLRNLITEVQANRECVVEIGEAEEGEEFRLEVDYWTNGRLGEYEAQLNEIENTLKEGENSLTTEQVKEIGNKITELEPILGEISEQAKLSILGSQLRVEIADRVAETLSSLGYDVDDAVYEEDDQRSAYVVKMKNIAGDEVVTVISPEKEFGVNSISINSFSPTLIDEQATKQNAKAIFTTLQEEGVEGQGEIECNPEPKQEYQDLEQVKQKKRRKPTL